MRSCTGSAACVRDPCPAHRTRSRTHFRFFWGAASFCLLPWKEKNKTKQIKQYLTSPNHSLRKQLHQHVFFFLFCFVRIFFFPPPGSNRENEKKGPHCSIVHIVSFFASEQRLFAAQLGTQWCSHKNEPLSSHTKLQIAKHCRGEARLSKFAYSHFPLLSSSYKTSRFC